jgi:hypothetical protein
MLLHAKLILCRIYTYFENLQRIVQEEEEEVERKLERKGSIEREA